MRFIISWLPSRGSTRPPACGASFSNAICQVHHLAWLWTPVNQVPHLNKNGLTARPAILFVDKANPLQNGDEVIEVTVDVADGDD